MAFQWHSSVHWTSQCTLAQGKGYYDEGPAVVNGGRGSNQSIFMLLLLSGQSVGVIMWFFRSPICTQGSIIWEELYNEVPCIQYIYQNMVQVFLTLIGNIRADCRLAPSQRETSLQSKAVSHWLGSKLESALDIIAMDSCGLFAHVPQTYFTSTGRSLQCPSTSELNWRIRVNRDGWEPGLFCDKYWSANGYSDCYIAYTWSADGYEQDDS